MVWTEEKRLIPQSEGVYGAPWSGALVGGQRGGGDDHASSKTSINSGAERTKSGRDWCWAGILRSRKIATTFLPLMGSRQPLDGSKPWREESKMTRQRTVGLGFGRSLLGMPLPANSIYSSIIPLAFLCTLSFLLLCQESIMTMGQISLYNCFHSRLR